MNTIIVNDKTFASKNILDFIDIGASKGGSYHYIKKKFGFDSGLCIDIDINKVNLSIANKAPAICLDATNMSLFTDNSCKLISILHTLEHLPSRKLVKNILKESVRVAKDKLYIKGPMYYIDYLKPLGFQFYWSHWRGHTYLIEPGEIIEIMKNLGKTKYTLNFVKLVNDSNDSCIHSINGLIDRHAYDKKIDPPKKLNYKFKKDIYKEFEIVFEL